MKALLQISALSAVCAAFSSMPTCFAQALPAATGPGDRIQVGIGYSMGKPDFDSRFIGGLSVFGDYELTRHIGLEADGHFLNLKTPADQAEDTYEGGARYKWRIRRFTPYAKVMLGYGDFVIQEQLDNPGKTNTGSFMYSVGGGLDIDLHHHLTLRAFDFEYQRWTNFSDHGLTPAVGTVGLAYRFPPIHRHK